MNLLRKLALLILASSVFANLLIAFDVVNLSRLQKLSAYIGFFVSVLFLLLGGGNGPKGKGRGGNIDEDMSHLIDDGI